MYRYRIQPAPGTTLGDLRAYRKWRKHPGNDDTVSAVFSDKKEAQLTARYLVRYLGCPINLIIEKGI